MNKLLEMLSSEVEERTPTPPDMLAHTLLEVCARYRAGNPFERGDLVTPRAGYGLKGEGRPHIVLDVFTAPQQIPTVYDGDITPWPDMRIACENHGDIVTYLGESWTYQPYSGPVAKL